MLTRKNTRAGSGERHQQKKINTFFSAKVTSLDKNVEVAEATLAFHSELHHHSYNSVDCTSKLGKVIYSDTQIANNVKCGRTKTEAIINHVLAPHLFLKCPAFLLKVLLFLRKCPAFIIIHLVTPYTGQS